MLANVINVYCLALILSSTWDLLLRNLSVAEIERTIHMHNHPKKTQRYELYNQNICTRINCMVRKQLYIFTRNSTFGIQLHVSALYIGHRQVVQ
jgi:hypothetical protein